MKRYLALGTIGLLLIGSMPAIAQVVITVNLGETAPEIPPGMFTDGGHYQISDFKGKVLAVFFFDGSLKESRKFIANQADVFRAMKGKPVRFLAVASNVTAVQARALQNETALAMPVFVDSLGLMAARYNFKIYNQNIWQVRLIGPTGKIDGVEMKKAALEKVMEARKAEPKYKLADYDAKLRPALELLEIGQLTAGLKVLAPFAKSSNKNLGEPAKDLLAEWKAEAERWKSEADDLTVIDPLKAYDLYLKVATTLPLADEFGKAAGASAKKLATDKTVSAELAARKSYTALIQTMGQVTATTGRPIILQSCKAILKKHPNTATAIKVDDLVKELEAAPK